MESFTYPALLQRLQAVGVETEPAVLQAAQEGFVAGRNWVAQIYGWDTLTTFTHPTCASERNRDGTREVPRVWGAAHRGYTGEQPPVSFACEAPEAPTTKSTCGGSGAEGWGELLGKKASFQEAAIEGE